jgi:predicted DNA-binding transcriptional regulator AlpA
MTGGKKRSAISAELIEANAKHRTKRALTRQPQRQQPHDVEHVHSPRGPPGLRLLNKSEVCAVVGASYPTLWAMMRRGEFPRSRVVGGKSMWLSSEVEAWLAGLPLRRLKGDGDQPELV